MSTTGSTVETRFKTVPDFYLCSPFRSRQFLSTGIILGALFAFSGFIVIRAWTHISVYSIAWIAFAMFWATRLFRLMLHSHASLRMLLGLAQVDPAAKESPLGNALEVIAEVSNGALFLSFFAIFCLLMAITLILSRH